MNYNNKRQRIIGNRKKRMNNSKRSKRKGDEENKFQLKEEEFNLRNRKKKNIDKK